VTRARRLVDAARPLRSPLRKLRRATRALAAFEVLLRRAHLPAPLAGDLLARSTDAAIELKPLLRR
jgi:hypothetical protein